MIDIKISEDNKEYIEISTSQSAIGWIIDREEAVELSEKLKSFLKKKQKVPFISHQDEMTKMGTSPRKAIRIIAQYAIEKKIQFYSKEQIAEFISRNIKPATVLQGLPGERILRTINYLKKNADFKWTLESVVKYAEEIDNLNPPAKQGLGEFIIK